MISIPKGTKAIIFDLGGVLLNLNMHKTFEAFDALGFKNFHTHFDSYSGSQFIEDFEEGKITSEEFILIIKKHCTNGTTTAQILEAWNAMLGELPIEKFAFLQSLKRNYKVFLYSNTNALHIHYFHPYYNKKFGENAFQKCFSKIYYSFEFGIRKPHKEGFLKIMKEQNLLPNQIFYIDDGAAHIATAKALGINCLLWKMNAAF